MNFRKIISLIVVVTIVTTLMILPVSATDDFAIYDFNLSDNELNITESTTMLFGNDVDSQHAPEVRNISLSSNTLETCSYISVIYDYFDEDGDEETETEITWYASVNGTDGWEEIGTGKQYFITENETGKYLKCIIVPVNGALYFPKGAAQESVSLGPVTSFLKRTNKFLNPGFENGVITPWQKIADGATQGYKGIEITSENPYSGSYALRVHPRLVNANDKWGQWVALKGGKRYTISAMARKYGETSPSTSQFEAYIWAGQSYRPYREAEWVPLQSSTEWVRVTSTFEAKADGNFFISALSFNPISVDVVMDDFYVGELMITDIENDDVESISLPKTGSVEIPFNVGKPLNQFGETKGLTEQTVTVNFPSYPGVRYENNKIIVDSTAPVGDLTVELTCTPNWTGASQSTFTKYVEIAILPYRGSTPKALNVVASGTVAEGNTLIGSYDFEQEDGKADASNVRWVYSDSADGIYYDIPGANSNTYDVESVYADKYIKFVVTPKTEDGIIGKDVVSNYLTVSKAPEVKNVILSTASPLTKTSISVEYEYYDVNGDEETNTEIIWYISENGNDTWVNVATGKSYFITENEVGKYIKCTVTPVNNAQQNNRGIPQDSGIVGPIKNLLKETNKFTNPGVESGEMTPWLKIEDGATPGYKGIEVTTDSPYSGTYALHAYPRLVNANDKWGQWVTLKGGKRYTISAMARKYDETSPDSTQFEAYIWSGSANRPYREAEWVSLQSSTEWVRVTSTFDAKADGNFFIGFLSFDPIGVDAVIDDFYVSELMVTDIQFDPVEPIMIPKTGTVEVPLNVAKPLNQFGDTKGLTELNVDVEFPQYPGVRYENGRIVVNQNATAGKLTFALVCTPNWEGASQSAVKKQVEIELLPHDDATPKALNVDASGVLTEGETLTGSYDFYQVSGMPDFSTVRWMYCDTADGVYQEIPGATSITYVVESVYANKFIKFVVTPKTEDGIIGVDVASDFLTSPKPPVATDVTIGGNFNVGGTIKGNYIFTDVNRDNEGETTFKWYYSDAENGDYTEILGADSQELILTENLIDKYIRFAVIPVSDRYPEFGDETLSKAYIGPTAPEIRNVVIENKNDILVASYEFYHPYNARELNSIYEWKVDGNTVSTKSNYTVNFVGTKNVTFSVTPIADSNPSAGKKVTVTVIASGNSSGSVDTGVVGGGSFVGGGSLISGGSSAGGGSGSINLPNNDISDEQQTGTDLDGHWGAEYIKKMVSRGVMSADDKGKYNPDETVTREDMLKYLFKTLKLEKSKYSGMFTDVQNSEFGDMLQTLVDNGIISVDTTFRPDDSISREEMCKILYISLENAGKLETVEEDLINGLSDYSDISDWAVKYVNAMYGIKMMIGVSEDRFAPKENVTKAQAATMLTRIISLIEGE